jgi:hypothetical protein
MKAGWWLVAVLGVPGLRGQSSYRELRRSWLRLRPESQGSGSGGGISIGTRRNQFTVATTWCITFDRLRGFDLSKTRG